MLFNVACSIAVVFMGGAVEIYTFSNVGYLASFIPVLIGYYLLRKHRPNVRRPFRLPEWMKYVALVIAGIYAIIYFYGGPVYANCTCNAAGRKTLPYYFIGLGRAAVLPAVLRVPQAGRGQAAGPPSRSSWADPPRRSRAHRPVSVAAARVRRKSEPTAEPGAPFERILLASEGRPISDAAIARVVELARAGNASVRVFSIARVHGVAFGLPDSWPAADQEGVGRAARDRRQGGEAPRSARESRPTATSSARASRRSGSSRRPIEPAATRS